MPLVKVSQVEIGDRFRQDLGDIDSLANSISDLGLLHPIVVTQDLDLIAGRRRLEAFKLLGREEIPATILDMDEIWRGELHENRERKDFTVSEWVAVKRVLEPEIADEARKRRLANLKQNDLIEPEIFRLGETRDIIAEYLGVSGRTLDKAETIVEAAEAEPELYGEFLKDADAGKKSVDRAFKDVLRRRRQQDGKQGVSLPPGVYDVIYADPPWRCDNDASNRGKAEMHYPTMELEDILNLPLEGHVAVDAVLFLWATNPLLPWALDVMEAWEFTYKTNIVWVKHRFGTGWYVRSQHELLLIGVRGRIGTPADEDRLSSVIHAPAGRHSEKPKEVYERIERMYPNRTYLELFARNTRRGWTSWGDEV